MINFFYKYLIDFSEVLLFVEGKNSSFHLPRILGQAFNGINYSLSITFHNKFYFFFLPFIFSDSVQFGFQPLGYLEVYYSGQGRWPSGYKCGYPIFTRQTQDPQSKVANSISHVSQHALDLMDRPCLSKKRDQQQRMILDVSLRMHTHIAHIHKIRITKWSPCFPTCFA